MTAFINTVTMEYPRHSGDIALDPTGTYAEVQWVDAPAYDPETQTLIQTLPENIDSVWRMVWVVREATAEELALRQKILVENEQMLLPAILR